MNRLCTITQKVPTRFGSLYVHVSHDDAGRVQEIAFSSPGKFSDTAVGDALHVLGEAVTETLAAIGGAT